MSSYQLEVSSVAVLVPTIYSMMKGKKTIFVFSRFKTSCTTKMDWNLWHFCQRVMHTYLWNVGFETPTDGFIQCPLSKLIHHNMTFGSSKFLLQQVPALDNKDEPNKLFAMNYIFYSTHQTNLCCTRSSSACLLLPRAGWFSSFSFKPSRFNWCQRSSGDWSGELISIRPWNFS